MQIVRCIHHDLEFRLPTTNEEFTSGNLHEEVEKCQLHLHQNPKCRFGELNEG